MVWRNVYRRPMRVNSALGHDMRRFHREMDFQLGGTRGPIQVSYPALNAWVNDDGLVVTAKIPGVNPEDLDISIEGQTLTLSGRRNMEERPESDKYRRRERGSGDFSRSVELPFQVIADEVKAEFHNGMLEIILPCVPEEKPKKIDVNLA